MVRLAIKDNPHFTLSDIELRRGGRSFTIDTVLELLRMNAETDLYFITGLDSFLEIGTWKDGERLLTLCSFVVLSREGYRFRDVAKLGFLNAPERELEALDRREKSEVLLQAADLRIHFERIPFYDISSTDIRTRVREGRSVKYLLPDAVERYIIENNLYA
jgi:nicotinate-nucleotide adenylyltransferase